MLATSAQRITAPALLTKTRLKRAGFVVLRPGVSGLSGCGMRFLSDREALSKTPSPKDEQDQDQEGTSANSDALP